MTSRDPFAQKNKQPPAPASGWAQPAGVAWGDSADEPKAERVEPESHSYLDNIPTADWQPKKRKKDTRKRGAVLFVRNIYDLKSPLKKISNNLGVPRDMLVRFLLEQGLASHRKGTRPLEPVMDQRLTLYPNEAAPRKHRKSVNQKGVGFRGLPPELSKQLQSAANELGIPIWQVIRSFLEQGISDYRSGQLNINPTPVQVQTFTLYPEN